MESIPQSSDGVFLRIDSTIDAQSTHDQATITPRSGHDRVLIVGLFEAKFKPIHPGFEAITPLNANRSHDAPIPLPRPPLLPLKSGLIFPLKACISLLCCSTFDRFMKELSKFRGRSLVHCDPPAFRLDCKAIGAGLIANFSMISSNFPLEFRTSTRKNPSKFASIHEN